MGEHHFRFDVQPEDAGPCRAGDSEFFQPLSKIVELSDKVLDYRTNPNVVSALESFRQNKSPCLGVTLFRFIHRF